MTTVMIGQGQQKLSVLVQIAANQKLLNTAEIWICERFAGMNRLKKAIAEVYPKHVRTLLLRITPTQMAAWSYARAACSALFQVPR